MFSMVDSKKLGSFQVACNAAAVARRYDAMVKSIRPICNLGRAYCYHLHKKDLLGSARKFRIYHEIFETHIHHCIAGQNSQRKFGFAKSDTQTHYGPERKYLFACNGDPKHRLVRTPSGQPGLNYLCSGLKEFWAHFNRYMKSIIVQVKQEHSTVPPVMPEKGVAPWPGPRLASVNFRKELFAVWLFFSFVLAVLGFLCIAGRGDDPWRRP